MTTVSKYMSQRCYSDLLDATLAFRDSKSPMLTMPLSIRVCAGCFELGTGGEEEVGAGVMFLLALVAVLVLLLLVASVLAVVAVVVVVAVVGAEGAFEVVLRSIIPTPTPTPAPAAPAAPAVKKENIRVDMDSEGG